MDLNRLWKRQGLPVAAGEAAAGCAISAAAALALGASGSWAVLGGHAAAIIAGVSVCLAAASGAAVWLLGGTRKCRDGSDAELRRVAASMLMVFSGGVLGAIVVPVFLRVLLDVPAGADGGWPSVAGTGVFLVSAAVASAVVARVLGTAARRRMGINLLDLGDR